MTVDDIVAHPDIARLALALRETPGREVRSDDIARRAAIAVVLRLGAAHDPELPMIKRAEHASDPWSGHVALPGGRAEPADRDLAHTAIRETWEETGIDVERVGRMLGTLDDLSPRTPILPPIIIRPFVAVVPSAVEIVESPEVAAAFWVSLTSLQERAAWGLSTISVRGTPREERSFTHGGHVVWGLTERVLRQLLERMGRAL